MSKRTSTTNGTPSQCKFQYSQQQLATSIIEMGQGWMGCRRSIIVVETLRCYHVMKSLPRALSYPIDTIHYGQFEAMLYMSLLYCVHNANFFIMTFFCDQRSMSIFLPYCRATHLYLHQRRQHTSLRFVFMHIQFFHEVRGQVCATIHPPRPDIKHRSYHLL